MFPRPLEGPPDLVSLLDYQATLSPLPVKATGPQRSATTPKKQMEVSASQTTSFNVIVCKE
jgi:hypothetical protein